MPGRERVRANLFFGTGGGVSSEKNLTWCLDGSEQHRERDLGQSMSNEHARVWTRVVKSIEIGIAILQSDFQPKTDISIITNVFTDFFCPSTV